MTSMLMLCFTMASVDCLVETIYKEDLSNVKGSHAHSDFGPSVICANYHSKFRLPCFFMCVFACMKMLPSLYHLNQSSISINLVVVNVCS